MKSIHDIKTSKTKALRLKKLEATMPQKTNFDKGRLGVKTNERALGS